MNFLLHRHLAQTELASAPAGFGAMLPDLFRMAHRRVRLGSPSPHEDPGALAPLFAGVAHHLAADAWFHGSPHQNRGEVALVTSLRRIEGAPKLSLFAHPLWEMCLDGALLRQVGLASTLDALRPLVRSLATDCSRVAEVLHFDGLGDRSHRVVFETRFEMLLRSLVEGAWMSAYTSADGLALCVDNMRARLGLGRLDARSMQALSRAALDVQDMADEALGSLLTERGISCPSP